VTIGLHADVSRANFDGKARSLFLTPLPSSSVALIGVRKGIGTDTLELDMLTCDFAHDSIWESMRYIVDDSVKFRSYSAPRLDYVEFNNHFMFESPRRHMLEFEESSWAPAYTDYIHPYPLHNRSTPETFVSGSMLFFDFDSLGRFEGEQGIRKVQLSFNSPFGMLHSVHQAEDHLGIIYPSTRGKGIARAIVPADGSPVGLRDPILENVPEIMFDASNTIWFSDTDFILTTWKHDDMQIMIRRFHLPIVH
jgi:hypothetical protein